MYCPQCGNAIEEDAAFCGKCGTPVRPPEALQSSDAVAATPDTRKIRIICIAVAAVVLVAALVIVLLFAMNGKAHQTYSLRVNTVISGTNVGDTSGVPLRIQGTDFESNPVDERVLVTTDDYSVDLMRGDYTLTVAGDPVGDSGALYSSSTPEASIAITEDEVKVNGEPQSEKSESAPEDAPELSMEFAPVPAEDVTEELLQETRQWMGEYGLSQEETDEYITAATEYKQAELKRIAEEKAEALRKAAFGSFPAKFSFYSGAGAWGSVMDINPNGSFEMEFHDSNKGEKGNGYLATLYRGQFAGSFTVVEQVNSKTFKLQLNELKSTHGNGESIDEEGLRTVWVTDEAYGLGNATSSPRQGYTLYLPGTSKSSLPSDSQSWLYTKADPLDCMVLVAPDGETWTSIS